MSHLLEFLLLLLLWTMMIYWTHRLAHRLPCLWRFHSAHHAVEYKGEYEFSWWNLVGWFNDWKSTIDQWLTEIIPTTLFVLVFPQAWPILVIYYVDGFVLAEGLTDHNPRIDIPALSMGKYHLRHHADMSGNYDLYFRLWDKVFGTQLRVC